MKTKNIWVKPLMYSLLLFCLWFALGSCDPEDPLVPYGPGHSNNPSPEAQTITIPVVVHILSADQDRVRNQVEKQIRMLNKWYQHSDFYTEHWAKQGDYLYGSSVPLSIVNAYVNPNIRFYLQKVVLNPTGKEYAWDDHKIQKEVGLIETEDAKAASPTVLPRQNMNIWVVDLKNISAPYGYAYLPSQIEPYGCLPAWRDGVIVSSESFGVTSFGASYRHLAHEVGHWLGLRHPWGPENYVCMGRSEDDGIADTPEEDDPTDALRPVICEPCEDLSSRSKKYRFNHMYNVTERCPAIFTAGQAVSMRLQFLRGTLRSTNWITENDYYNLPGVDTLGLIDTAYARITGIDWTGLGRFNVTTEQMHIFRHITPILQLRHSPAWVAACLENDFRLYITRISSPTLNPIYYNCNDLYGSTGIYPSRYHMEAIGNYQNHPYPEEPYEGEIVATLPHTNKIKAYTVKWAKGKEKGRPRTLNLPSLNDSIQGAFENSQRVMITSYQYHRPIDGVCTPNLNIELIPR